jgi:hypothetical protein
MQAERHRTRVPTQASRYPPARVTPPAGLSTALSTALPAPRAGRGTLTRMPRDPNRPAALTGQVFRGAEAVRRGALTADELRSAAWLHLRHDVYADARLERDHALACRAALIRLPPTTVLAGPSAAYLHGAIHAAGFHDDIHVITPPVVRVGAQRGLRAHHLDLPPSETTRRAGLPLTSATRTAWDLAAWLDPVMAVPIIDTLLALDLTTPAALTDLLARHANQRGWRRAQRAFTLADAGAQSPPESRLRVRLVLAGLPKPVAQCPVRVSPALILHPDLAWEEWRVAVEYDRRMARRPGPAAPRPTPAQPTGDSRMDGPARDR